MQKRNVQNAAIQQRVDALETAESDSAASLRAAKASNAAVAADAEAQRGVLAELQEDYAQLSRAHRTEGSKVAALQGELNTQSEARRAIEVQLAIAHETRDAQGRELAEAAAAREQDAAHTERLATSLEAAQQRVSELEATVARCATDASISLPSICHKARRRSKLQRSCCTLQLTCDACRCKAEHAALAKQAEEATQLVATQTSSAEQTGDALQQRTHELTTARSLLAEAQQQAGGLERKLAESQTSRTLELESLCRAAAQQKQRQTQQRCAWRQVHLQTPSHVCAASEGLARCCMSA